MTQADAESMERHSHVFRAISDAVIVVDLDGRIIDGDPRPKRWRAPDGDAPRSRPDRRRGGTGGAVVRLATGRLPDRRRHRTSMYDAKHADGNRHVTRHLGAGRSLAKVRPMMVCVEDRSLQGHL